MTTLTTRDLDAEYLADLRANPAAIELIELEAGQILTVDAWAGLLSQACAVFGVDQDRVLSTPYGLPPLPRPPDPDSGDTRRVWHDISIQIACHPVFWLPRKVVARRAGEDDDVWAVRLYLELIDRGAWDLDANRPQDAFLLGGIDSTHPEVEQDLADYQQGQSVPWLDRYELPANPVSTGTELAAVAQRVADRCRDVYWNLAGHQLDAVLRIDDECAARLRNATVDGVLGQVRSAAAALQRDVRAPACRSTLLEQVQSALGELARLDDARLRVSGAVEHATTGRIAATPAEVVAALRDAAAARQELLDTQLGPVLHRADDQALAEMWSSLTGMFDAVVNPGRQQADQMEALRARHGQGALPAGG